MTDYQSDSDGQLLSSQAAERLLARAAELDSHQRTGAEIAELRAAAAEAGIRPEAFDAAVAEMRSRSVTPAAPPRAHFGFFPRKPLLFAGALLALAAGIFTSRVLPRSSDQPVPTVPASPGMPVMIYPLHCMTPEQAVAFVRPIVRSSGKAEVYGAEPHAILIQAPVPIASAARAALKERDAAACKLPAAP